MNIVAKVLLGLVAAVVLMLGLWTLITLNYTYSSGERAGYIQKISKKGWICKTWEGEMNMANIPGSMPLIFAFTVRDDAVAQEIEKLAGQRATLRYEQHRGIPTSCFGDTGHFIVEAKALADVPASATTPTP